MICSNPLVEPERIFILHARSPFALCEVIEGKIEFTWSESGTIDDGLQKRMNDWYIAYKNDIRKNS